MNCWKVALLSWSLIGGLRNKECFHYLDLGIIVLVECSIDSLQLLQLISGYDYYN